MIRQFSADREPTHDEAETEEDEIDIWLKLPYIGHYGEVLVKAFVKKVRRMLKTGKKVNFKIRFHNNTFVFFYEC